MRFTTDECMKCKKRLGEDDEYRLVWGKGTTILGFACFPKCYEQIEKKKENGGGTAGATKHNAV